MNIQHQQPTIQPGKILNVRHRLWRVDDFHDDIMTVTAIEGQATTRRFYAPVESIEDGKLLPPKPEYVGNKRYQNLLTNAYRLSMIHGTAPLMSLQRSKAVPEAFQMVPVVMSLSMPRVRMLIADDVGLGKTIEAGLIITELLARQKASRVLIICPAALREQWKTQLAYFFHLDAEIISSRHRRQLERSLSPGVSPWTHYPLLITSMDYVKQPLVLESMLEGDWDVVVFDEAHNCAKPHQVSQNATVDMARWNLLRKVAKVKSRHLLLLTATPHNGFTDTFASLLRALDVDAVIGSDAKPTIRKEIAKKYVCQRRRIDVEGAFAKDGGRSPFPSRDTKEVYITPSAHERDLYTSIEEFGEHVLSISQLADQHIQRILAKWTVTHFHKRALSSPHALRCSLRNRRRRLQESESDAYVTVDEARAEVLDDDPGERVDDEQAGSRMEQMLWGDHNALQRELELIDETMEKAKRITPRRDQKLHKLLTRTLTGLLRRDPKVIIFTRYRDTLNYLTKEIAKHSNFKDTKVISLDGTMNTSQRRENLQAFGKANMGILVATDCISEGMNLQHYAAQLIHYELPWNPNRLEQRNGRIDRYGQKRMDEVAIRTMVVEDSLEAGILQVLVRKANQIRQDHGFAPPFFGDNLSVLDLIQDQGFDITIGQAKLSDFCEDLNEDRPEIEPYSQETIDLISNDSFYGHTEVDVADVGKRMKETERLIGTRETLKRFVLDGLGLLGSHVEKLSDDTYVITVKDPRLKRGLKKSKELKATFDREVGLDQDDLDVIVLGHPLVRNLIEILKDISYTSPDSYGRTACIKTDGVNRMTCVYHYLVRYSVETKPASIIEELLTFGFAGNDVLSADQVNIIREARSLHDPRSMEERSSDLEAALSHPYLAETIKQVSEARVDKLSQEREKARQLLADQGANEAVEGIAKISIASIDMLAVTVYYPEVR